MIDKILEWFEGNLSDKTTWIAICGFITAFNWASLTNVQVGAIAFLGATLFTVRDKHIVAAGSAIKNVCTKKPIQDQVKQDENKDISDIVADDRNL